MILLRANLPEPGVTISFLLINNCLIGCKHHTLSWSESTAKVYKYSVAYSLLLTYIVDGYQTNKVRCCKNAMFVEEKRKSIFDSMKLIKVSPNMNMSAQ